MYRATNLQNERECWIMHSCDSMHASYQVRFGSGTSFTVCVSTHFSIKNKLAFKLFCTSWMKTPCTELTCVSVVTIFHCLVKWFQKVKLWGYSNTVVSWRLRREWHAHVKLGLSLRINTVIKNVYYLNMFHYPFYLWYLCLLLDGRLFVEMWAWCCIGKIAACVFHEFLA